MKLEIQAGVTRVGKDPDEMSVIPSSAKVMNLLIFGCRRVLFWFFSPLRMPPEPGANSFNIEDLKMTAMDWPPSSTFSVLSRHTCSQASTLWTQRPQSRAIKAGSRQQKPWKVSAAVPGWPGKDQLMSFRELTRRYIVRQTVLNTPHLEPLGNSIQTSCTTHTRPLVQ